MDNGKILELAVKGSALLNSVRITNRAMKVCRICTYAVVGIIVSYNICGIIRAMKQ